MISPSFFRVRWKEGHVDHAGKSLLFRQLLVSGERQHQVNTTRKKRLCPLALGWSPYHHHARLRYHGPLGCSFWQSGGKVACPSLNAFMNQPVAGERVESHGGYDGTLDGQMDDRDAILCLSTCTSPTNQLWMQTSKKSPRRLRHNLI